MLQKPRGLPYSLTTRSSANGTKMFVARFRKDDGAFGPAKSTGIQDTGKKKDRDLALSWCEQYAANGQIVQRENLTLGDFGTGFFDWAREYAQDRILRGKRYSKEQAELHSLAFAKWIKDDRLGKAKLSVIDDKAVSSWQLRLAAAGLAPKTIHQRTMTLRILLKAAYSEGYLRRPIQYEPVSGRVLRPRGVLTLAEASAIFAQQWDDHRHLAGNLLAVVTGLRAGEIVGLRHSKVLDTDVLIVGTWRPKTAIVSDTTKGGAPRRVPVPPQIVKVLQDLMTTNPWARGQVDPYVFWSVSGPDRAMDQRELTKSLHTMIDRALGAGVAKSRNIGMHSWRAFANTEYLEAAVPSAMIRRTIGHTSDAMTALYYRPTVMAPVRAVQDAIASAIGLPAPVDAPQPE